MNRWKYVMIQPGPRGGRERHYFRFQGATVPLNGQPGSAEYLAHHAALLARVRSGEPLKPAKSPKPTTAVMEFPEQPKRAIDRMLAAARSGSGPTLRVEYLPGSIGWTIERYLTSHEYRKLTPGTQASYRPLIDAFKARLGAAMVRDLTAKNVTLFVCEFQRKHGATRGKSMLAVISNVWQHALGLEACRMPDQPVNPTTYAQVPRPVHKQHTAWPPDIRERFLDGAPDYLRLLFSLLLYTGQRRSDVAKMKWADYKAGVIHVRQRKTGEYVPVPVHKRLAKVLAETPRA